MARKTTKARKPKRTFEAWEIDMLKVLAKIGSLFEEIGDSTVDPPIIFGGDKSWRRTLSYRVTEAASQLRAIARVLREV